MIRALLKCRKAAAAAEFALVAPIFLTAIFGVIETSRLLWTKQALEDVAYATARCMSVSTSCANATTQKSYAVARAAKFGVVLPLTSITPTPNTTCQQAAASSKIAISQNFASALDGIVPGFPVTMRAVGCYPTMPAA